jgi:glutaredoxin 2
MKVDKEYNLRANLKYIINPKWSVAYVQDNFKIDAGGNYYVTKTDISILRFHHWLTYSHEPFGDVQGDLRLSNSLSSLKK